MKSDREKEGREKRMVGDREGQEKVCEVEVVEKGGGGFILSVHVRSRQTLPSN